MLLRLYGALTTLAQPLLRRKLRRRAVAEPGYAVAVEERFGHYQTAIEGVGWCWVHAVSLGETRAAGILIAELRKQYPGIPILLTHGTATGRDEGAKLLVEGDLQVWQPWDMPSAVDAFLDKFQPRIGVLIETEVWPVMCAACAEREIPLVLANARLSEKSHAAAERLMWLARPAYGSLAAVYAQTEADAHRLVSLGAKVAGVYGNLKFDATPDVRQLATATRLRPQLSRPVIMLASSREGEELQLLEVLRRLGALAELPPEEEAVDSIARRVQAVQWMIVPRHPQRFDEVAELLQTQGFAVARRSAAGAPAPSEIWLGDSLGEMALYYGLADAALLGGSFAPVGGQNLIEAAACGCPVIMGPSTFNFEEAARLSLEAGASRRVETMEQAVMAALGLVEQPARRESMAEAAFAFSSANRGAAERTAAAILAIAERASPRMPRRSRAARGPRTGRDTMPAAEGESERSEPRLD